jgi:hypothetical protein
MAESKTLPKFFKKSLPFLGASREQLQVVTKSLIMCKKWLIKFMQYYLILVA